MQLEKERKISASYQDELRRVKEQHLTVVSTRSRCIVWHQESVACWWHVLPLLLACLHVDHIHCICAVQQSQVEQEEEYITNKLMKRLEQLKKEKQILATEVNAGSKDSTVSADGFKEVECADEHYAIDGSSRRTDR
jgi:hypothetical protein